MTAGTAPPAPGTVTAAAAHSHHRLGDKVCIIIHMAVAQRCSATATKAIGRGGHRPPASKAAVETQTIATQIAIRPKAQGDHRVLVPPPQPGLWGAPRATTSRLRGYTPRQLTAGLRAP